MNRSLYATVLIIIAIGLYFTITKGVLTEAKVVYDSNQEYVKAIQNAKDLIVVRDKVIADFNRLSENDKQRLDKVVPQSIDNIRLIIDLKNIASRHGFALKSPQATAGQSTATSPQNAIVGGVDGGVSAPAIAIPVLETVTVSFGITAPYQQFISFLQDLEASLRILDITSLSVTSNDSGLYDWKIELKTYWLRN